MQQAALPIHRYLQAVGHSIEIAPEVGEFVVAAADRRRHAHLQIAAGDGIECRAQAPHRLGDIPCKTQRAGNARQQGRNDGDQLRHAGRSGTRPVAWASAQARTFSKARTVARARTIDVTKTTSRDGSGVRIGVCARPGARHLAPARSIGRHTGPTATHGKQQIAPSIQRHGFTYRRGSVRPSMQFASLGDQGRSHLATERVAAGLIDGEHHRSPLTGPIPKCLGAGVMQYGRGVVDAAAGPRTVIDVGECLVEARLREPEGAGNGDDSRELRQPRESEEFPEQPAHGHSLRNWYP